MAFIYCSTERGAIIVGIGSIIYALLIVVGSGGLAYYDAIKLATSNNGNLSQDTVPIVAGFYFNAANTNGSETFNPEMVQAYTGIMYNLLYSSFGLFTLIVSHELLAGIKDKNFWRCGTWLRWQIASLLFKLGGYPVEIILFTRGAPLALPLSLTLVGWALTIYCMHVVIKFMNELKIEAVAPDGHTVKRMDNVTRYRRSSQGTIMLSCGIRKIPGHV